MSILLIYRFIFIAHIQTYRLHKTIKITINEISDNFGKLKLISHLSRYYNNILLYLYELPYAYIIMKFLQGL